MRTPRPFVLALTTLALAGVTATAASTPAQSITDSYASLVGGVDALHWSFTASTLQLLSATAFPVAVGEHGAYVAASVYGEGRCVAFGHEGMMLSGDGGVAAQRLVGNALAWLAGLEGGVPGELRLVVHSAFSEADAEVLSAAAEASLRQGVTLSYAREDIALNMPLVAGRDVLVVNLHELGGVDDDSLAALVSFVEAGGGVMGGGHAWWWGYNNKNAYANHPANRLLLPLGFGLDSRTVGNTWIDAVPTELPGYGALNLWSAHAALDAVADGTLASGSVEEELAFNTITGTIAFVPSNAEALLWEDIEETLGSLPGVDVGQFPMRNSGATKLALAMAEAREQGLPADELEPSAWASEDGSCGYCRMPNGASRRSETAVLTIDGSFTGRNDRFLYSSPNAPVWRSTGLYLAPGEAAEVTLPAEAVDSGCILLQVGQHSDTLYDKETLDRPPKVVRSFSVVTAVTKVANAHGGLLYVVVEPGCNAGELEVRVDGAYDAPRFVLGLTDPAAYAASVASPHAAPWSELESGSIVLTVKTAHAAAVADEAVATMEHWERAMAIDRQLAPERSPFARPERIVTDTQIGAGWMHSGYPIMGHMAHSEMIVSKTALCAGADSEVTEVGGWGPYHELGHNFQGRDWLLEGTTESSCNLFSLIVAERECGAPPGRGHPAMEPGEVAQRKADYSERDFHVWYALDFFIELKALLGGAWEDLGRLLAVYSPDGASSPARESAASEKYCDPCTLSHTRANWAPDSTRARFDLFMVRAAAQLGAAKGAEVAQLFGPDGWNLPVSEDALASVLEAVEEEKPSKDTDDEGALPSKKAKKAKKKSSKKKKVSWPVTLIPFDMSKRANCGMTDAHDPIVPQPA